jgi:putative flippase GtrA
MPAALDRYAEPPTRPGLLRRSTSRVIGHSVFRFLVSGGAGTTVDAGLLFILHGLLGVWLPLATLLAVVTSFAANFSLNRFWSFGSQSPVGGQMLRYLALAGGNWVFTVITVTGMASLGLHYLAAKFITIAVAAVLNYFGYRHWVFR